MPLKIRNLQFIRDKIHPKLAEALLDLQNGLNEAALQAGVDAAQLLPPPSPIQKLNVAAANGIVSVSIQDSGPVYKSVKYWLEWATEPTFQSPRLIPLNASRTWDGALGNVTAYFRAYSEYPGSNTSPHVYFGGQSAPTPVVVGGVSPPTATPSTGAGTASGNGQQGGTGSGPVPFRPSINLPQLNPRLSINLP